MAKYTVRNDSSAIGAEISLQLSNSNSEYFKVTETIDDDMLQAGESTYVTVRVEMIKTPIEVTSTSVVAKLNTTPIDNEQAIGGESKEVVRPTSYVYTINMLGERYISLNQPIGTEERVFNSFAAAKAEYGHPIALAHEVDNGKVSSSYVVFEKNNELYYLQGGAGDEFGQESMPIYEKNVQTIKRYFGENWSNYCSERIEKNYRYFYCPGGGGGISANTNGEIYAYVREGCCFIDKTQGGACACR